MKILIVDDDEDSRTLLQRFLRGEGYELHLAADGREGVARFEAVQPDIVLMDVMMPEMDGYEAARAIKAAAGERFVPVIFLTAVHDEKALARCVEFGGDDFLTKPYSRVILLAKIDALRRVCGLYRTLQAQRDELRRHENRLLREQELAERVFTRILRRGRVEAHNIRFLSEPAAISNGDLLLADRAESGHQYLLLGDFTGHGLSAAMGALPVSQLFHRLVAEGAGVETMVSGLNDAVREVLPTGMFFAAAVVEYVPERLEVTLWSGGIPDVLLYRVADGRVERIVSRNLPMGVVGSKGLAPEVERLRVGRGDRLFLYSDGVIEARNGEEALFGPERLEGCLQGEPAGFFSAIVDALARFRGNHPQDDDISLLELLC
ncbi:PP2C family protein-serine/threonine phosphatase [Endothiovibrio diazotrophicus]